MDLEKLNEYFADHSYLEGYQSSRSDSVLFNALKSKPEFEKYPYLHRWYKHIDSFGDEINSFVGETKSVEEISKLWYSNETVVNGQEAEKDEDLNLFDSEEEDEEAARIKEERLKMYAEKKAKKPCPVAKSSVVLEVKPWNDETDMKQAEEVVRSISCDGLLWGASKLVPVGYGIQKLQIGCVVEDEKVSIEWLTEEIEKFNELVQSADVVAFNKI